MVNSHYIDQRFLVDNYIVKNPLFRWLKAIIEVQVDTADKSTKFFYMFLTVLASIF